MRRESAWRKGLNRLLILVLAVTVILSFSFLSVAFAADSSEGGSGATDTPSQTTTQIGHSKSKTATNLDSNYESKVTLSMPSKEEKLATDVVFVLDKSTSSSVKQQITNMLSALSSVAETKNAKINVGVVVFNKQANTPLELTELNSENLSKINDAVNTKLSSGTNLHAGILAGTKMLEKDTSVDNSRKYMVVISDGITYMYDNNGTPTTRMSQQIDGTAEIYAKGPDTWDMKNGRSYVPDDWQTYLDGIASDAENSDFDISYDTDDTESKKTYIPAKELQQHASGVDKALYLSWKAYQNASTNYHTYAAVSDAASVSATAFPYGPSFMRFLANGQNVDFGEIQNDILYLTGAGSTITDYMGYAKDSYNFDLVDPSKMEITVEDTAGKRETYQAKPVEGKDNTYGFNYDEENHQYAYEVTYSPADKNANEMLTWTTNVPITNFQHVSLTYTVKLMNPKTAAGAYGQLDLNGDGVIDGSSTAVDQTKALYTNGTTTLKPKDSQGNPGGNENFTSPSVSYTIGSTPVNPTTPAEEHTVTFHPENDQPTFNQTVPDGGQAVKPDDPTNNGYKFDGWYTDPGHTNLYDFSTKVTSDLDLYAKWTKTTKPVKPTTPTRKVSGVLLPKVIAKGKHTQVFTWTALTNVDGYFIYTNHCDEGKNLHPFKKVADYKATRARVYTKRNLKTYNNYKYYVAAYQIRNGKKVIVKNSCTVHSVCGNTSARSTNVKATKAKKHAITLKKGKTYTLKASVYKISKNRAFLDETHCGLIRYLVRNDKIATVGYHTGKIKAKKAGKTTVYVLGVNGIRDKCVVTVK